MEDINPKSNAGFLNILWKNSSIIIAIIVLICSIWTGRYQGNYVNSDGKGYYAYLTAIFIYGDLDYNFIDDYESKYYLPESYGDFRSKIGDDVANITFVGVAVLWLPFFLAAHIGSYVLGLPTDGYAPLYQYAIGFAAVFYLFLALWGIKKLLKKYRVKAFHIALIQTIMVFATPIYFYTTVDASFTHVYSFAAFTLFLLTTKKYIDTYKPIYLYLAFFIFGLIVLIRPSNMIVAAALPFIAGEWNKLRDVILHVFREYKQLIIGVFIMLLVVSIQPILYYIQVGKFFIMTYTGTGVGFNFMDPHFISILFSYKKGLFVYTPVLLFSFLGFIYLFRKRKFMAWSLLLLMLFMNYILASWWSWWYGMSYGNRAFIDYFVFFALLFGFALKETRFPVIKYVIYVITPIFIILNLIQTFQYKHFIFYWDMNEEMYWRVFLKTDKKYYGMLWNEEGVNTYEDTRYILEEKVKNSTLIDECVMNMDSAGVQGNNNIETTIVHSGSQSVRIGRGNPYSPGFNIRASEISVRDTALIKISAFVYSPVDFRRNVFSIVLSVENSDKIYHYKALTSEGMELTVGEWNRLEFIVEVPRFKNPDDFLKAYLWYRGSGSDEMIVDDLKLRVYQ